MKPTPHFLLHALLGSLSHKVRTPLSVIQNDLSSWGEGGERPLRRCDEIASLLDVVLIPEPGEPLSDKTIAHLVTRVFGQSKLLPLSFPVTSRSGEEVLLVALVELRRLMEQLLFQSGVAFGGADGSADEVSVVEISAPASPRFERTETYLSLTSALIHGLEQDSLVAPLIDAILLSHGGSLSIHVSHGLLHLRLTFGSTSDEGLNRAR